jgi:Ankyrin repeat
VNAANTLGMTPLMFAREVPIVRLLLDAGASIGAKTTNDSTVLHMAASQGCSAGVICCLLKAGVDATTADADGIDAAAIATGAGHATTAALLQRAAADQRLKQQQQQQSKQTLQLQPCAQCGQLTKKRCRCCQAVYYCSEECQIQCFRDPQHRAQCEQTAATTAATAAIAAIAAVKPTHNRADWS